MATIIHVVSLVTALAFVVGDIYVIALWAFGVARTGYAFFWILTASAVVFLLLAIINAVLIIAPRWSVEFVGRDMFFIGYAVFLAVQPIALTVSLVGQTLMLRYVLRGRRDVGTREA